MPKKGTGVYHRKNGLWEARYVRGYDQAGRKQYGSVYAHTCKEAKEKRQEKEDQIRLYQRELCSRKITVSMLASEWLHINTSRLRRSSYQKYDGFFRNHIEPHIGDLPILFLTPLKIHEFSLDRLSGGLSPQTVNTILVFLHTCFQYGYRQYRLPVPEISYLPESKKRRRALTAEEQQRLLAYLVEDMDISKLGVLLTLYSGLRIGEICALTWGDISNGCIYVSKTMQRLKKANGVGTEIYIGPPKTNTSTRIVPIPDFLQGSVERFRREEHCYFLSTPTQSIVEPRVMHYRAKKYLAAIGVTDVSFHGLRHTFATRCAENNVELKSLSELLGHSSTRITSDIYLHPSLEFKRQCINNLPQPNLPNAI
ncbi:MAG: site-specific integrase [Clostridia bacterium]|nr:site-specific integrase [Clostridia bacterium]